MQNWGGGTVPGSLQPPRAPSSTPPLGPGSGKGHVEGSLAELGVPAPLRGRLTHRLWPWWAHRGPGGLLASLFLALLAGHTAAPLGQGEGEASRVPLPRGGRSILRVTVRGKSGPAPGRKVWGAPYWGGLCETIAPFPESPLLISTMCPPNSGGRPPPNPLFHPLPVPAEVQRG